MRCIAGCNYREKPDSASLLRRHMEFCSLYGPLKSVATPYVVWRDREFVVVSQAEEGEQTYNDIIQFVKPVMPAEDIIEIVEVPDEEPVEE